MNEQNEQVRETTAIVEAGETHPITPAERILAPLELADLQNVAEWAKAVLP